MVRTDTPAEPIDRGTGLWWAKFAWLACLTDTASGLLVVASACRRAQRREACRDPLTG